MPEDAATRSAIMRAVKGKDTRPELLVRRMVHAQGFRYRLHSKQLPGKPDLVFPAKRKVILVHGCFWHGHPCKRGARVPTNNHDYWVKKIAGNMRRDKSNLLLLTQDGWRTLIVWECEIKDRNGLREKLVQFLS